MEESSYAEYTFNAEAVGFINKTVCNFEDKVTGTFRWECKEQDTDTAMLNFFLTFTGKNGFTVSTEACLNFSTNELSIYKKSIGPTFLWGPKNLAANDTVVLWHHGSDKVTGKVVNQGLAITQQGNQNISIIEVNGAISGRPVSLVGSFDSDTGIFVDGRIDGDPILFFLGIEFIGIEGRIHFDTNINLGPNHQPEQASNLILIIPIIAFIPIFIAIYRSRRKNHIKKITKRKKCAK